MPLTIKYIPLYSSNAELEAEFFLQYFRLSDAGSIKLPGDTVGRLLKINDNIELYLLFIPYDGSKAHPAPKIIIQTTDCLKEYVFMKGHGVDFRERPQKFANGLGALFKLTEHSEYLVLEERDYNFPLPG